MAHAGPRHPVTWTQTYRDALSFTVPVLAVPEDPYRQSVTFFTDNQVWLCESYEAALTASSTGDGVYLWYTYPIVFNTTSEIWAIAATDEAPDLRTMETTYARGVA